MLTRENVDDYSAPAGSVVRIVCKSRDNNDTDGASYRYNQQALTTQTLVGLPGCEITVVAGTKVFKGQVAFDTSGETSAAYDLSQLDAANQPLSLEKTVSRENNEIGFFSFNITGSGQAAALAGAPRPKKPKKKTKTGKKTAAARRPSPSRQKARSSPRRRRVVSSKRTRRRSK